MPELIFSGCAPIPLAHAPVQCVGFQRGRSLSTAEIASLTLHSGLPANASTGTAPMKARSRSNMASLYWLASYILILLQTRMTSPYFPSARNRFNRKAARMASAYGESLRQTLAY